MAESGPAWDALPAELLLLVREGGREAAGRRPNPTSRLGPQLRFSHLLIPDLFQFVVIGRRRPPQPPLALRVPLTRAPPRSHALH